MRQTLVRLSTESKYHRNQTSPFSPAPPPQGDLAAYLFLWQVPENPGVGPGVVDAPRHHPPQLLTNEHQPRQEPPIRYLCALLHVLHTPPDRRVLGVLGLNAPPCPVHTPGSTGGVANRKRGKGALPPQSSALLASLCWQQKSQANGRLAPFLALSPDTDFSLEQDGPLHNNGRWLA